MAWTKMQEMGSQMIGAKHVLLSLCMPLFTLPIKCWLTLTNVDILRHA